MNNSKMQKISLIEAELLKAYNETNIKTSIENLCPEEFDAVMKLFVQEHSEYNYNYNNFLFSVFLKSPYVGAKDPLAKISRSFIIEKKTFKCLFHFSPKIIYDEDAEKYLENNKVDWNEVQVRNCFKEVMLSLYYFRGEWRIGTVKKVDAFESYWNSTRSCGEIFKEILKENKIQVNTLNKKFCYFFIYLDKSNKRLVDYSDILKVQNYKCMILTSVVELYSMVDVTNDNKVNIYFGKYRIKNTKFKNLEDLNKNLEFHSQNMKEQKKLYFAGYTLLHERNVLIMRPKIYKEIENILPNYPQKYMCYLELFVLGKLEKYLDMIFIPSEKKNNILEILTNSFDQLSIELLQIYHYTRNKKNVILYDSLPKNYKEIIYSLHGEYLNRKSKLVTKFQDKKNYEEDSCNDILESKKNIIEEKTTLYNIEIPINQDDKKTDIKIVIGDVINKLESMKTTSLAFLFYTRITLINTIEELSKSEDITHPIDIENKYIQKLVMKLYDPKFFTNRSK